MVEGANSALRFIFFENFRKHCFILVENRIVWHGKNKLFKEDHPEIKALTNDTFYDQAITEISKDEEEFKYWRHR